jgi:hypothetical protein
MGFAVPKYVEIDDVIDRAFADRAKGCPLSLANMLVSLRWMLAGREIDETTLPARIRKRAAELNVELVE